MTYRSASGKQFVVIAAGGHAAMETKRGDQPDCAESCFQGDRPGVWADE